MLNDFDRLETRAAGLGNHHRKYVHFARRHAQRLGERLEALGGIDEIHFGSVSPDPAREMDLVSEMGRDEDERLSFLGCYFAFQILNLNTRAVDALRLGLASDIDRFEVYRDFMLLMGRDIRRLCGAYMTHLFDLFIAPEDRPGFAICGVGTRADQDDLDLGLIDDGGERRDAFNTAVARVMKEMMRRAIPLHMHLSEHVGTQRFSASIAEFSELLDGRIRNFIIITELLGARRIMGSEELFRDFTTQITDRYYFDPGGDNRHHEGYLRGMMGEIDTLLLRRLPRDSVHPKRDALRIIKGLLSARKTVHGIREVNAWRILEELMVRDQENLPAYARLEDALSFIEVFRFLYQLLEVQEEKIHLGEDDSRACLETVAELMGYHDVGVVRAHEHLLIHYHEHVMAVRAAARVLQDDLRRHLEDVSVFSDFLRRRGAHIAGWQEGDNIAVEFVETLRFFRGTRYWDDVMGPIRESRELLTEFVNDFMSLDDRDRAALVRRYAKWSDSTILVVLQLLVLLYEQRSLENARVLFGELSHALVERLEGATDVVPRMTAIFDNFPKLVNDVLIALNDADRERFTDLFEPEAWNDEIDAVRRRLLHFCRLHCTSSRYFKRFLQSTVDRYPECLRHLGEPERLEVIAKGFFARYDTLPTFRRKLAELGSYYDLEFVRLGLECREGGDSERINAEFTEFVDNYMVSLFDICKQEVAAGMPDPVRTRDLLAVYACGGHGRKLAFDDDYDLIILLDSDDPDIRAYCGRIMTLMNSGIVKRGTMPQYRFAERFGHYVTTFDELDGLFTAPDETAFIDMSQLMGARRIVGGRKIEAALYRRIIKPHILDRAEVFCAHIAAEIRSRHEAVERGLISTLNVKETKGGLRDIELMLMILMARAGLWLPVTWELRPHLDDRYAHRAAELDAVFAAFRRLKHIRDIYHLSVAAEDEILPEELGHLARVLGAETGDAGDRRRLAEDIEAQTTQVADIVRDLLDELGL